MTKQSDKANQDRIRDNQRRSRQRRKEHLQAVEDKLRLCQKQGVEASIEIQQEARKVAEENKQLRILLHRHGIEDECITVFLVSGTVLPPRRPVLEHGHATTVSSNVQTLEQLLEPRRPRCLDDSDSFCVPSKYAPCSRPSDPAPTHTDSIPSSVSQIGWTQHSQYITAPNLGASRSRTEAAIALKGLGSMMADHRSPANSIMSSASIAGEGHSQAVYGYSVHLLASPTAYEHPDHSHHRLSLQSSAGSAVASNYLHPQATGSNCSMATDIISGMTGVDPHHVRGQLGCMPGMGCHVDNASFHDAVDRYTASTSIGDVT